MSNLKLCILFFLACWTMMCACGRRVPIEKEIIPQSAVTVDWTPGKVFWVEPGDITPLEFLRHLQLADTTNSLGNFLVIQPPFPDDWVKAGDVDSLLIMAGSKLPAKCVINIYSSYIPKYGKSQIGGYALRMLEGYRKGKRVSFGLYSCLEADSIKTSEFETWLATRKR